MVSFKQSLQQYINNKIPFIVDEEMFKTITFDDICLLIHAIESIDILYDVDSIFRLSDE